MKETIKRHSVSVNETHIGLLEYSDNIKVVLPLNKHYEAAAIIQAVDRLQPSRGTGTVTDEVLSKAADIVFGVKNGGRPGAARILVILTDKKLPRSKLPKEVVKTLNEAGVRVYVVTTGEKTGKGDYRKVVPDENNEIHVKDPKDLRNVVPLVVETYQEDIDKRTSELFLFG